MATQRPLTTAEFAQATGIPAATISRLIRQGRLKARKQSGKWMIPPDQLEASCVREFTQPPAAPAPPPEKPGAARQGAPAEGKTYSIAEFAAMTYLTEKGVAEWLRNGKLRGGRNAAGELEVLASNLESAGISRLVRK
jgi:excisionase family DNA binding protein